METFTMDKAKLQELANEFAKGLKTQHDLNDFTKMLTKLAVETALNAELTEHLGYEKHQNSPGNRPIEPTASKVCADHC